MACNPDICFLISTDVLCQYTKLVGFTKLELSSVIEDVNFAISEITGSCDLCEDFGGEEYEYQELIDSKEFQRYYAKMIEHEWIRENGSGQLSKSGYVRKEGDELSEFSVAKPSEIKQILALRDSKMKAYESSFLTKLKELHKDCLECSSDCTCTCGGSSNGTCAQTSFDCTCGCTCSAHNRNKDVDNYSYEKLGYVPCEDFDEDYSVI